MTKLGLISDPHASAAPVAKALSIFKQEQVDTTIVLLQANHCEAILGNHEIWYLENTARQADTTTHTFLNNLPTVIHRTIDGKHVYMVHASPPDSLMDGIHLLDQTGHIMEDEKQFWLERLHEFDYDVLIVGHTHQVFAEQLGGTLVINPGSSRFNHSCAILSLPELTVQWFDLSDRPIQKTWNWRIQSDWDL